MYDEKVREQIIGNYKKLRELKEEQERLLEELQGTCDHETVIEGVSEYGPWRSCLVCLLEERGQDFKVLKVAHLKGPSFPRNDYDKLKPLKTVLVPVEE